MFKFQEFELRLSLPPLWMKFVCLFVYKVYNCVSMKKKVHRKCFVRPFWYSQENISVNVPKHVDYISLKLCCFHTLTEKQFERGNKEKCLEIYANFNHQKTQDVKLPLWLPDFSSFQSPTHGSRDCVGKFPLAYRRLVLS